LRCKFYRSGYELLTPVPTFDAMLKRLHGHRGATLKETALPILSAKASEASK